MVGFGRGAYGLCKIKDFARPVLTLPAIPTTRIQPVFGRDFGLRPL